MKINNAIRYFVRLLAGALVVTVIVACVHTVDTPTDLSGTEVACRFSPATVVHCGRTPTTGFDAEGRLWASYVVGEHVYVSRSDDLGKTYRRAIRVNREPEEIYTNGENRPKIGFGRNGEVYVSWTQVREGRFAGDIRFARSEDGGRRFDPVRTVNDDGLVTSHRFETLFMDSHGNIYMAWLDKRDQVRVLEQGGEYNGAALYYTVSTDNGRSFADNRKVADYSCECCRVAMSETEKGDVAVYWRHIFGDNIRDHAFAVLGLDGVVTPPQRPAEDNWHIEACPHHGPAMVTAADGSYHLSWFSLGDRKGIFYGRYDPVQGNLSHLHTVATTGSSHPYLARDGQTLFLVWKQFDGERTNIMLIRSDDEGRSWQPRESLVTTAGASDHPLLIQHEGNTWLSWHTGDEGLRVIPVSGI